MLVWKGCPSSVSAVAGDSTHCAQLTVRDGCASLVFYMVFILSFLRGGGLNQQRLSSGQSASWQPILQSAPSVFDSPILCYFQSSTRGWLCTMCARFIIIPIRLWRLKLSATPFQKFAQNITNEDDRICSLFISACFQWVNLPFAISYSILFISPYTGVEHYTGKLSFLVRDFKLKSDTNTNIC